VSAYIQGERAVIQLPEKRLFRPGKTAELTRIRTAETVHDWIRAGKIKYVLTPGGQKRIPRAEVERIILENVGKTENADSEMSERYIDSKHSG
jgi:excisionase family DNA binding protein